MPMLSMYFDEVDTNKDGKVTRQEYFSCNAAVASGQTGQSQRVVTGFEI